MTWVEGIGDEVVEFFIGLFVVIIGTIAWWSTRITDRPTIRTVLVFERRAQNRSSPQHTQSTPSPTTASEASYARETDTATIEENKPPSASTSESTGDEASGQTLTPEEEEQNSIVQSMDSDSCLVRRRRLDFFNQQGQTTSGNSNVEASVEPVDNANSDDTATTTQTVQSTETDNTYIVEETVDNTNSVPTDENDITIKLKYINDDLKLVNGKLQEPLGDFRRRHFEPELSSNKLVKLIFNGQVLQRDDVTLEGCGLFDNCVVHCLIHQKRPSPMESNMDSEYIRDPSRTASYINRENGPNSRDNNRDWDLGNLFFAVVSFVLGAAWYFRYEYAQLYTVTATVALVGLTGIFTVLLVGMYFPDSTEPVQPTRT